MKRLLISVISLLALVCCNVETGKFEEKDTALRFISIVPSTGEAGSSAIISGINFTEDVEVFFGTKKAEKISTSHNRINVIVPQNEVGTYPVSITKGNETAGDADFTYVPAGSGKMTVTSIVPDAAYVGSEVVIYGQGFGDDPSDIKVLFDDIEVQAVSATRNIIHCLAPEHTEGDSFVSVKTSSKLAGTLKFTYKHVPTFQILSVSPLKGKKGSTVIITGELFSNVTSENLVMVGDAQAEVVSATDQKLTVIMPDLEEGVYPITVTVEGKTAGGFEFTYLPKSWIINYFAGNGANAAPKEGVGINAVTNLVQDMDIAPDGLIWMSCRSKSTIMTLDPKTAEVKLLVSNTTVLNNCWGGDFNSKGIFHIAVKAAGTVASVSKEGIPTTLSITKGGDTYIMSSPMDIAFGPDDVMYVAIRDNTVSDNQGCIAKVVNGEVVAEWPAQKISAIKMGPDGKLYWGSETFMKLCCTDPATGITTVVAGNGEKPTAATFTNGEKGHSSDALIGIIRGISFDEDGALYFTEQAVSTLRKIVPTDGDYSKGTMTTVAGIPFTFSGTAAGDYDGAYALNAKLSQYVYAVLPYDKKTIFLSDGFNFRVNKLTLEE